MHTGAMLALVPTREDAERLALTDGEDASELHVTIGYYGDVVELSEDQRYQIMRTAQMLAGSRDRVVGNAFSVNAFNPTGEDPCLVYGIGGGDIEQVRDLAMSQLAGLPPQRRPYVAHLTAVYTDDLGRLSEMTENMGPITFDRVRVAFGDEVRDLPMGRASVTAAINDSAWKSMPLAPRETKFNADDAIARGLQWSGNSASKFNSLFLFRINNGEPGNRNSYRLPIADIIGGKPVLIPRAVFSAAVILSGGHGGLEGVASEAEKKELKAVVSQIYDMLQEEYQDPRTVPPWELGGNEREDVVAAMFDDDPIGQAVWTVEGLQAAVNTNWRGVGRTDPDHGWDGDAARARVWEWSEGDFRKYRKAFLWYDSNRPDQKGSYKLPIADVIDGELKIVPKALSAVSAALNGARGGVDIPDDDMASVERVVERLSGEPDSVEAAVAPVYPHSSVFEYDYSKVNGPTPFTITADGRAFGHLWLWNRCHAGIVDQCIMAPRTATNYQYFHNGQVLTSDGKLVKVGKITMGTGHAGPNMRWMPAADHYDNTGTVAAIVRVTEDPYGGYANGVPVSSLTDEQMQELRRSPISGDWRRINGNLELVAALAVNTPGFPIVASINGEPQSLVSAGLVTDEVLAAVEQEKLTEVEQDLTSQVDALDEKLNVLAQRGRTRKWGKLMAALDERSK